MSAASSDDDPAIARVAARLAAHGAKWKITDADARKVIARIVESIRKSGDPDAREGSLDSIRFDDLALATACRNGIAAAWETFIENYRPMLYRAARAVCGDESAAREIADSLWAELYGTEIRDGERRSLLDFFHGRSSLATWMRAIVAQRHVDRIRATCRLECFDPEHDPRDGAAHRDAADPLEPEHRRLMEIFAMVLAAVIGAIAPRDRARLGYYYREGLTVRQIGRIIGEHESTVSRKLEQTRREIRNVVEKTLRLQHSMSADQIRFCYEHAAEDSPLELASAMPAEQVVAKEGNIAQRKQVRPFEG